MQKPAIQALTCWVVAFATVVALLFAILGKPETADGASEAMGRTFAHSGFAALCVWLLGRRRANPWSWPKFVMYYLVCFVTVGVVSTIGHVKTANGDAAAWPFKATFPDGWVVEHKRGASSAPQDEELGVRTIARPDSGVGAPVIQLSCAWKGPRDPVDLDVLIGTITSKLEGQYRSSKTRVETISLANVKIGTFPTRAAMTKIFLEEDLVLEQESVVALTDHCLFGAEVGALPSEFQHAAAEFATVLRSLEIE